MMEKLMSLYEDGRLEEAWSHYCSRKVPNQAWHYIGSMVAYRLGNFRNCYQAASEALEFCKDDNERATCIFMYAESKLLLGDFTVAIERFEKAIALMRGDVERELQASAWHNLSIAHSSLGHDEAAFAYGYKAANEFMRQKEFDYARQSWQNCAWIAASNNHIDEAERCLNEAKLLCDTDDSLLRQTVAKAFVACAKGEYTRALIMVEHIITSATEGGKDIPSDVESLSESIAAEVALRRGDYDRAYELASCAHKAALEQGIDHRCCAYAQRLMTLSQRKRQGAGG